MTNEKTTRSKTEHIYMSFTQTLKYFRLKVILLQDRYQPPELLAIVDIEVRMKYTKCTSEVSLLHKYRNHVRSKPRYYNHTLSFKNQTTLSDTCTVAGKCNIHSRAYTTRVSVTQDTLAVHIHVVWHSLPQ
jgi:hypothetical protein